MSRVAPDTVQKSWITAVAAAITAVDVALYIAWYFGHPQPGFIWMGIDDALVYPVTLASTICLVVGATIVIVSFYRWRAATPFVLWACAVVYAAQIVVWVLWIVPWLSVDN
jgi:hypothetical protein